MFFGRNIAVYALCHGLGTYSLRFDRSNQLKLNFNTYCYFLHCRLFVTAAMNVRRTTDSDMEINCVQIKIV